MQSKVPRQARLDGVLETIRHEPMNRRQLAMAMGVVLGTVDDYIATLRRKKLIYIAKWVRTTGQQSPYWQTGNLPDAPKPPAVPQREKVRKHIAKKKAQYKEPPKSEFAPRRDIAASWF